MAWGYNILSSRQGLNKLLMVLHWQLDQGGPGGQAGGESHGKISNQKFRILTLRIA
jgi:hypothetical protein